MLSTKKTCGLSFGLSAPWVNISTIRRLA
jgi:hypothetical protein